MIEVSVVIPAFRASPFIADTVRTLDGFLAARFRTFELIVVDDGSADGTPDAVRTAGSAATRCIELPRNRGKFGALKVGMTHARGRCRIFTDADLPYELEALDYIARQIGARDVHMVVGDRTLPDSEYAAHLPPIRRVATHAFAAAVRLLVTGGLHDTQCGLKGFRHDVAEALFPLVTDEGFSGDVEVLYIALKYNLEIRRIPVRLRRAGPSSVQPGRHAARMLSSIARLPLNWRRGRYHSDALRSIARQAYWGVKASPSDAR